MNVHRRSQRLQSTEKEAGCLNLRFPLLMRNVLKVFIEAFFVILNGFWVLRHGFVI